MDTFIFVLLGLTSVVALTFIVERGIALRWNKVIPPAIRQSIESYNSAEELGYVQAACEQNPSACGRLLFFATQHVEWPRDENVQLLEARGISDALYATLAGLVIAIPALICWSYYSKKIENLTVELETLCDEFLRKHYHGEAARRARGT
jgi:hypothetical protein